MPTNTADLRIRTIEPLTPPNEILREFPITPEAAETVTQSRASLHRILQNEDDRLAVVIGPCSIHDPVAALDYAERLAEQRRRLGGDLEIIMRVYFEKPRTTVGWKGLINDPDLDGSFRIDKGLRAARHLLLAINDRGLPAGCEFLDMITPQYIADLVGWGAIGARTTESQMHRELASGLSCPVGFKNGTDGNVRIAVDAVKAAGQPHHFLAVSRDGRAAIAATSGNGDCHIILRGGHRPNFDATSVEAAAAEALRFQVMPRIMIDTSHANSDKMPERQPVIAEAIGRQIAAGDRRIMGVMIESHILAGRQELGSGRALTYGQSITDGCIDWPTSVEVLEGLAAAVRQRRRILAAA